MHASTTTTKGKWKERNSVFGKGKGERPRFRHAGRTNFKQHVYDQLAKVREENVDDVAKVH
jgi:hypothetical protein